MADVGAVPAFGAEVAILVDEDTEHVHLSLCDLTGVPDAVGRPRPARVTEDGRAELLAPLDPPDLRDDTGSVVTLRGLLGPFPAPRAGEVVLVTWLDAGLAQVVSTALQWVAGGRGMA